jgi:hypothetical protein
MNNSGTHRANIVPLETELLPGHGFPAGNPICPLAAFINLSSIVVLLLDAITTVLSGI